MAFEEPKKNPFEQSEPDELPEQIPIENSELNPNKEKFAQELGKVFPAVLEESEDFSSVSRQDGSFESEADRRKIIARDKINGRVENNDTKYTAEKPETSYSDRTSYNGSGAQSAVNDEPAAGRSGQEPQHIGSILNTSGYSRHDSPSVRLKTTSGSYQQQPGGNKSSVVLQAITIGFVVAFITLAAMLVVFR